MGARKVEVGPEVRPSVAQALHGPDLRHTVKAL
jgi:hypothetical protein